MEFNLTHRSHLQHKNLMTEVLNCSSVQQIIESHKQFINSEGKEGELADFSYCKITDFDFSGQDLSGMTAQGAVFTRCLFIGCDLYSVSFSGASLVSTNFSHSNLGKAEMYDIDARDTWFDESSFGGAEFFGANLEGATFRSANFGSVSFIDCNLVNTVFDEGIEF